MTEQTHQAAEHAQPAGPQKAEYAPQTSHPLIQLQGVIGNQALLKLLNRKTIQRFAKQADVREQQFVLAAQNYGLEKGDAKALYQLSGGPQADPVTGFEDASDRDPTLARAIQAVGQSGDAGFTVDVSIRNLGGLNAQLGHNEADKILNVFAKIVGDAMAGVGGDVSKFRQGGTELRFILVGKDVRQSHIEARLMEAQANITKEVQSRKLDQFEHPKHKSDLSQKGTGIQYDIHPIKPYHNADEAQAQGQNGSNAADGKNFKSAAQLRREAFVRQAVETYHLSEKAALDLYQKSGAAKTDSLTGFDSAADRITTLKNAMQYVRQSGSKAFYVEIDLRNLGGLTQAVGRGKADAVFARMASMAEASLKTLNADLSRFRHGGDEFSFILVGDAISAEAIDAALTAAQGQIAEYVKGEKLADIEHPKHPNEPDKRGTGIIFGISSITGADGETTDQILSAADLQVEAKKH
jgi:GGDEF domain-containing protein